MRSSAYFIVGSLAAAVGFAACSPSAGDGQGKSGAGASANGGGDNGSGTGSNGSNGTGVSGNGSTNGTASGFANVGMKPTGPGSSDDLTADASCAGSTLAAESIETTVEIEVPYEIVTESVFYIMQDRSGSMVSDAVSWIGAIGGLFGGGGGQPAPNNKWDAAVGALTQFAQDPASAGTELALDYFPDDTAQCNGAGYDVPTVPMGELPGHATSIIDSLTLQAPNGNTPTEGALRGMTQFCEKFNADQQALVDQGMLAEQDQKSCVGILITDGSPTACNQDTQALANIAAAANANGVLTFAVGMDGSDPDVLNAIAQAGGGDCTPNDPATWACDVSGDPAGFIQALNDIRESVQTFTRTETRTETQTTTLECEWGIPEPPPDEEFNRDLVNVRFATGGTEQSIGYVPSEAECANVGGGWYYDDPDNPETIKVCEDTCNGIQNVPDARIDILLGCAREEAVPE